MFDFLEDLMLGTSKENFEIDLKGDFNFHVEPSFKGAVPLHTLSIVVTCLDSKQSSKPIDFSVKWSKIMDSDVYGIKDYDYKYYHVNPSDIDLKIRAVITPITEGFTGTAFLTIGPIILDGSLKPELEGLVLNKTASFKCTLVTMNNEKVSPNLSLVRVTKPNLEIIYDQKMISREPEANRSKFDQVNLHFEKDKNFKVKVDSQNINNCYFFYTKGEEKLVALIKFDNRMQRDVFYIYLKLMRMLKPKILEDMDIEYDSLLEMPWCFLKVGRDVERYDELRGYQHIYGSDALRELLKVMVRLNKSLQDENVQLLDSVDIIEQDLQLSMKEFGNLLEDGKVKNTKNLRKYERSQMSIMQESSIIIDGLKEKNKRKKRENEEKIIETTRDLQDNVTSLKKVNEVLKKEIEALKGGPKLLATGTRCSSTNNMESLYLSVIQVFNQFTLEHSR